LLDADTAYLQLKLASSSNFDLHRLLKSTDGGQSWQEVNGSLPAPAMAASAQIAAAASALGATATASLSNGIAWAYVQQGLCSGPKPMPGAPSIATQPFDCIQTSALLATPDNGQSWIDITPNQ
jgi:photosystem II stability/assembly factor-like uncharacterized protein